MEKSRQPNSSLALQGTGYKHLFRAMTLVEVLVALAIVSFVFSALTALAFDALSRAKKLELQDQMRSYATETEEYIYNLKNSNWGNHNASEKGFTDIFNAQNSRAYIKESTGVDPLTGKPTLVKELLPLSALGSTCTYNTTTKLFSDGCDGVLPTPAQGSQLFARQIRRTDIPGNPDNQASIEIIISCISDRCKQGAFQPFVLNITLYRTGGAD